jgi:uncharacterized membrane protein YhaH (DUF805 family)
MDFFFSERIGRLLFLGRYVINFALILVLQVILEVLVTSAQKYPAAMITGLVLCAVFILPLLYYFMRFIVMARLRSIGLSGWFGLLVLVPFINLAFLLFLLFCPADSFGGKGT